MNPQLSSSPLVSVVIPVYNGEMHISVCMDSILCQSFSSFEAIFVDDGSVDNSFRILSERASFDRRMKVIRQENMGVTCARRNGVKHAGGKYICFVDCDDRLLPDTLDILYNKAKEYFDSTSSNVKAYLTRHDDTFINLYQRPKYSKRYSADLFLSLHMNFSIRPRYP